MPAARPRDDLRDQTYRRKVRPAVLIRDGYICHICRKPIDPNLQSPHPMSATLDHIVGPQTGSNPDYLKAAHRICNLKRGNPRQLPDPQPRRVTRW